MSDCVSFSWSVRHISLLTVDEEVRHAPRVERAIAIAENDHYHPAQANPSRVWLEPPTVWEIPSVDALSLARAVEEDIGNRDDDVV